MRDPDAIVIGAGHNGLTCAAYLARAGLSVLVLEQYGQIGGLTRSEELTGPGFSSDVHGYGYQLGNLSPAPRELELERNGFELLHPDPNWVHAFPDGRAIECWRDIDETCRSIAAFSQRDADAWRRLNDDYVAQRDRVAAGLNHEPEAAALPAERRARLSEWAPAHFESPEMQAVMAAWACHVGLAPEEEGSAAFAQDFVTIIQNEGNNVVRGGMQKLCDALAASIREHGGAIRTAARVERIVVERGRAVGVRLAGGEEIRSRGPIVANANPARVLLDLLREDEVGSEVTRKMGGYRFGLGALCVFLALDEPAAYAAGAPAGRATYVHPSEPSMKPFSRMLREARSGLLPTQPFVLTANEGAVDPSRAPQGRSVMKLVIQPVPFVIEGDARGTIDARTWQEAAEPYADRVLDEFERDYAPGLRARTRTRVLRDPAEELSLGFDTVNGCMTHGAVIASQLGANRPIAECGRYRTPVEGVYLCGSGTHPGGGVSMMPGRNAAAAICEDLSLTEGPA